MNATEEVKDGVLPDPQLHAGEDFKEKPGAHESPDESLQEEKEPSPRPVHGWKWVLVCISVYTSALIYGLDTTIAADIQAAIVERFDNVERLTWIGTAFPLGSVCAILPT